MNRQLIVCDDGEFARAAELSRQRALGIEVQAFYRPEVLEDPLAVNQHRAALVGVEPRSMHGPFADLAPGSIDPMLRGVAMTRYAAAYEAARSLDVTDLVVHHGYVPGTSAPSGWLARARDFWQEFLVNREDIRVHLENHLERDPRLLSDVVTAIGRPNLDVCLDVGHIACYGQVSPLEWVDILGEQIGYVHLHDNHGAADEHLALGQGTIPLERICQALTDQSPSAVWALEVDLNSLGESIDWLGERGFVAA